MNHRGRGNVLGRSPDDINSHGRMPDRETKLWGTAPYGRHTPKLCLPARRFVPPACTRNENIFIDG